MKRILIVLLAAVGTMVGQVKEFTISSDAVSRPVTVTVSYTLPSDDPLVQAAQNDALMKPTTIVYYWGDEIQGAKIRSYTKVAYGQTGTHTYKTFGKFGILVVVTDAKNRLIRQAGIRIAIQQPMVVDPKDEQ